MDNIRITLAACRANTGMTQAEMAQKLHIDPSTLVQYESIPPRKEPGFHLIQQISKLSGIPINYIYVPPVQRDQKKIKKV